MAEGHGRKKLLRDQASRPWEQIKRAQVGELSCQTMDPEVSLLLLCPLGGLSQEQVAVKLSPAHDRCPLPGGDKTITAIWETRLQAQPWIFDAPKFHLHPEPQSLCSGGIPQHKDLPGELVVRELFSSVLQEICDEVNQPLLLGIACNEASAGRASAEFYVQCSLTPEEVRSYYLSGGPEAHESTGIIFVETQRVQRLQETETWAQLCPSAKGTILHLYSQVLGSSPESS